MNCVICYIQGLETLRPLVRHKGNFVTECNRHTKRHSGSTGEADVGLNSNLSSSPLKHLEHLQEGDCHLVVKSWIYSTKRIWQSSFIIEQLRILYQGIFVTSNCYFFSATLTIPMSQLWLQLFIRQIIIV